MVAASATLLGGCSSQPLEHEPGPSSLSVEPVTLSPVYTPPASRKLSATALAFNGAVDAELWVMLRQFPSGKACTLDDDSGCAALVGVAAVVSDATTDAPRAVLKQDGNAWHFMRRPTSIAWGDGELFASCGEALTDNYEDDETPYAGPVLWSSDPTIFGVKPLESQNGTHLDMLHETPYCMGLAHETANVFWAFNGEAGALDRVDFHSPHEIGGSDHSDGEVHRYVVGQLSRVPEVPSHVAYDSARGLVYVADTGHGRVVAVDPKSATPGGAIEVFDEALASSGSMDGASVTELVPPGTLKLPSGLALVRDTLYVSDNATGLVHSFDTNGHALRVFDTALPAGALSGIALGPDQALYLANLQTGTVTRFEVSSP